jgi:hypothetical protein
MYVNMNVKFVILYGSNMAKTNFKMHVVKLFKYIYKNTTDFKSQILYQQSERGVLFLKKLVDPVAHPLKRMAVKKAVEHCGSDCRNPQGLALESVSSSRPALRCMVPLYYGCLSR